MRVCDWNRGLATGLTIRATHPTPAPAVRVGEVASAIDKRPLPQRVGPGTLEVTFAPCPKMVDGRHAFPLATSQDHKRLGDGDVGPNTGGMGAYSPAPVVTPAVHNRVMHDIIRPVVDGMAREGIPFTGFLYAGLMIDGAGNPRVVEFNARLGDPEAEVILFRLNSDLFELFEHAIDGTLDTVDAEWDRRAALTVVLAASGYPDAPQKGAVIHGLELKDDGADPGTHVFHAGTIARDGRVLVNGGRVLAVTAVGDPLRSAQRIAYDAVNRIGFEGMQYRRDIGHRALKSRSQ